MNKALPIIFFAIVFSFQSHSQSLTWLTDYPAFQEPEGPCLPKDEREILIERIQRNREKLVESGAIDSERGGGNPVTFAEPLEVASNSDWNSGWVISYYADNDTSSALLDWNCTERTYDGHQGTDYSVYPFAFHQMDNDMLNIVAAAPGVIVDRWDGNFDENCEWPPFAVWNGVAVQHSDGTVALYGHMKNGSVTNKTVGESVALGEYLGIPASSGYSSGPHLHFEVLDVNNDWVEPHEGDCNSTDSVSSWTDQLPFWNKRINAITVHEYLPTWGCPRTDENTYFETNFHPGDSVFGVIFTVNVQVADTFYTTVKRPDGSLFTDWLTVCPINERGFPLLAAIELPNNAMEGVWTIETQYYGADTLSVEFNVQTSFASVDENELGELSIYPNPAVDEISIELPANSTHRNGLELEIFGSDGKLILRHDISYLARSNLSIQTVDFASGLYQVRLFSVDGVWTGSFVKK